ncbi:macrophage colony-stimulating factor 1 receptor 2 [Oryzias melastigma]|uniref:macrophage colony-stimulating factor 1 receptor 2 n=1 Tax=Oryzias melastigma TaxID=30732 RepID=UPI000CF82FD8|nr:macrophage colony-stimulating factor 1 receptor 2 [Oryzias melastigma]
MWLLSVLVWVPLSGCCAAETPGPPRLCLNSTIIPNQSDITMMAGSAFSLSCHGNRSVRWSSTALGINWSSQTQRVKSANPRHTGTYTCGYTNQSLEHLNTSFHLYIKDPSDPSTVFVTRRRSTFTLTEGEDFLLICLLTDPSVTNLTLQRKDGRPLPPGMNVTLNPQRGAWIQDVQVSFRGQYVCSGWRDGKQFRSSPLELVIRPLRHPPTLSISQTNFVRLEGELFEVTCQASNQDHFFNVTWTHRGVKKLNTSVSRQLVNKQLIIRSTLTVSAVSQKYGGEFLCIAHNEGGVTVETVQLRVLDRPYLQLYLYLQTPTDTNAFQVKEDQYANVSSMVVKAQAWPAVNPSNSSPAITEKLIANISNERNESLISNRCRVDVHEGGDVRLTIVMEAYPPVKHQKWMTPAYMSNTDNTVFEESYTAGEDRSEATLLLRRVRQEDQGRYSFHFSNPFFNGSQDVTLLIYSFPTVAITQQNHSLSCSSSGYPRPTVLWFVCLGIQDSCMNDSSSQGIPGILTSQEEEEEEVRTLLPMPTEDHVLTVECAAFNLRGRSSGVFHHCPVRFHSIYTPVLIGAISAATILLLLLLVVLHRWRKKPKYEIRWKIIESTDGNNYVFVDPSQLPYNQEWEFPRDKLRLGAVLGSGAFGKVVEATAYGLGTDNKATRVAVKMLKPSAHSEERDALMSELKILSHLGYHNNIVNLLGACTQGGPMWMITEYCIHGDLLNFLRVHAQDLMALTMLTAEDGEGAACYKNMAVQKARLRSDSGISCCSEYQEMQPILSPGKTQMGKIGHTPGVSLCDLMMFSYQVAQGLDFLSTRNCIHRDVAARNVLLTDQHIAKICDFGLARDIRNDDSYIVQGNARLPVKWMAPESIFQCVYTLQSDVWSYGVLLWEIFSLGKSPYPNVAVDANFYRMIKDGHHMEAPDFAPAEMYHLMTLCWSLEPTHRPTFKQVGEHINRLLLSTCGSSGCHSPEPTYRNIDDRREEEEVPEQTLKPRAAEESGHHDNRETGAEKMEIIYKQT